MQKHGSGSDPGSQTDNLIRGTKAEIVASARTQRDLTREPRLDEGHWKHWHRTMTRSSESSTNFSVGVMTEVSEPSIYARLYKNWRDAEGLEGGRVDCQSASPFPDLDLEKGMGRKSGAHPPCRKCPAGQARSMRGQCNPLWVRTMKSGGNVAGRRHSHNV